MIYFFVTGRSKHVVPASCKGGAPREGPRVPRLGRRHKRLERGKLSKTRNYYFNYNTSSFPLRKMLKTRASLCFPATRACAHIKC